jgi:hypothetical protein
MTMTTKTTDQKKCKRCGQSVTTTDGKLDTHGPGPKGEFICPGSGNKGMVKAGSFKV